MSYEGYRERSKVPGQPHHPEQKPLLPTVNGPPTTKQTLSVPSYELKKAGEVYLTWFTSPRLDFQQRCNMMLNSNPTDSMNREIELIGVIRQLCPNVRVDMQKSDMGWSEDCNTVFLLLHLRGVHSGYDQPSVEVVNE
jgi:hypothetical protein